MEQELEKLLIGLKHLPDWQNLWTKVGIKLTNSITRGKFTLFGGFDEQIYFGYIDEQTDKITKKFVKENLLSIVDISDARFIVLMIQKYKGKEPAIVGIDLANKINPKITRFSIDTKGTFNLEKNKPIYKNRTLIEQLIELSKDLGGGERTLKVRYLKKFFEKQSLTEKFYEVYKTELFDKIKKDLIKKFGKENEENINNFVLVNLNRLLFIHFLDRKGTVFKNYDKDRYGSYISYLFHKVYKDLNSSEQFYNSVLKPLFFETFNKPYSQRNYNNSALKSEFGDLPYLNGGLFRQSKYEKDSFYIDNVFIKSFILNIIDAYNFTIKEDTPFDVKVSVDPELLGYIFENLIQEYDNSQSDEKEGKSKKKSERNDSGVFYTPKIEVDFMCRQVLIEYLAKKEELENKKLDLYKLFYDEKGGNDKQEYGSFNSIEIAAIFRYLSEIKVVDPACGSGAFLVGMMQVILSVEKNLVETNDALIRYSRTPGIQEFREKTEFQKKKDLIKNSLYGVDIKSWAVEIAKLRLWLSMIIDVKEESFKNENAKNEPLLPSFGFHIVQGDSLVNRIGDKLIPINATRKDLLDKSTRDKIETLVDLKNKFYDNEKIEIKTETVGNSLLGGGSIKMDEHYIKQQEKEIYEKIISNNIKNFGGKIKELENQKNQKSGRFNTTLFGSPAVGGGFVDEKANNKRIDKEIEEYNIQIESLQKQLGEIKGTGTVPFSWGIDFADVFTEREGFDVVVGNPPYVRQEEIADATGKITDKKVYKKILGDVANQDWFNDIKKYQKDELKIGGRADLYIYFYFRGLKLLNPQGVFTFITSNSRLDVDFGAVLQEFLIKYCPSIKIFDNQVQRSFASAAINTVMCFFDKPVINTKDTMQGKAQFINFKKSYEESVRSEIMAELDHQVVNKGFEEKEIRTGEVKFVKRDCDELRSIDIDTNNLWLDGSEIEENNLLENRIYEGNKWGGKFLKAPEIFFTILSKGKEKIIKLSEIADVKRGFTTGVNDFFYLPNKYYDIKNNEDYFQLIPKDKNSFENIKIEKNFLKEVIKSPKEIHSLKINKNELDTYVLIIPANINIEEYEVGKYIKWGEKMDFSARSTVSSRKKWYLMSENFISNFVGGQIFNDRFVFSNSCGLFVDCVLNMIGLKEVSTENKNGCLIVLNSSLFSLMISLYGRTGLGEGALKTQVSELKKMPFLEIKTSKNMENLNLGNKSIFEELGFNKDKDIYSQIPNPLPDRKELDDIVFDELGLTQEEKNEVYWSLAELVQNRLNKGKSV